MPEPSDIPYVPLDAVDEPGDWSPEDVFGVPDDAPPEAQPPGPGIKASEGGAACHRQVLYDVRYLFVPGHTVLTPAEADGAAGQVVKLHAGYWVKEVVWTMERANAWPVVPHPDTRDPNEVLLPGTMVQPADPLEGPGGSRIYRVSGTYRYRLLAPPFSVGNWGPFPTAVGGHTTATQSDNTLPVEAFDRNALAGTGGGGPKAPY